MRRQRGIALVLVLWVLSLLTVMAMGLTVAQRTETALSDNHVSAARFRAAADAAIAYTVLLLSMPPAETLDPEAVPWLPNGVAHTWRFGGVDLRISIFNEMSRIDLNGASPELLIALLTLLGAEIEIAESLGPAIVDWRDEDDAKLLNGAEDAEYEDEGRAIGPKNGPYVVVEELLQVLGLTPDLYLRLASEVSVDLEGGAFDERFASAVAIAATQGVALEDAELLIEQRDAPLFEDGAIPQSLDRGGPLYRIDIREDREGRPGRRMEALVELLPGQQPPYQTRWRRLGLSGGSAPAVE